MAETIKPRLKLRVVNGMRVLTSVTLNGKPFKHATRISFDTGDDHNGLVMVRMEFLADIEIDMVGEYDLVPVALKSEIA